MYCKRFSRVTGIWSPFGMSGMFFVTPNSVGIVSYRLSDMTASARTFTGDGKV